MAQVPYQPFPTVPAEGVPARSHDYFGINASPEMFGAQTGRALQNLGGQIEKSGQEFLQAGLAKAQLTNELYANDANSDAMQKITDRYSDYQKLEGEDAHNGLKQYKDDIQQIYRDTLSSAPNLQAKVMLSKSMRYMADYYMRVGTGYADQQWKAWQDKSMQSAADKYTYQAVNAMNNPVDQQTFVNTGAGYIRNLVQQQGKGLDAQDDAVLKYRGHAWGQIIGIKAESGDPQGAATLLHEHENEMDPASRLAILTKLRPMLNQGDAQNFGDMLLGRKPFAADFADRVAHAEGGTDRPNANSTAAGIDQFINDTWLKTVKRYEPDAADGKSDAEILAMRSDPALSRRMTVALAGENSKILGNNGVPVNDTSVYLAHFLGPNSATRVLKADPDTPVSKLIGQAALDANPFLKNMSAGQLQDWATKKIGVSEGGKPSDVASSAMPDKGEVYKRAVDLLSGNPAKLRSTLSYINEQFSIHDTITATDRAELGQRLPDIMKAAEEGVTGLSLPIEQMNRVLPPAKVQQLTQEFEIANRVGEVMRGIHWAAPEEVAEMQRDIAGGQGVLSMMMHAHAKGATTGPGVSGADPDAETAMYFRLREGAAKQVNAEIDRRQRMLVGPEADPAAYVASNPTVAAEAQKVDEKNPQSFADYATASLAVQDHLGVPTEQQHVLTRGQAQGAVAKILSAPPDQRAAALTAMPQAYGAMWPHVLGDMVSQGKLPTLYEMVPAVDNPAVKTALTKAIGEGKKNLVDALPKEDAKAVDDALDQSESLRSLVHSFSYASDGATKAAEVKEGIRLAAYGLAGSQSPKEAVRTAVNAFTSEKYDFWHNGSGVARVPKTIGEDRAPLAAADVEATADETLRNLKGEDLGRPRYLSAEATKDVSPEVISTATIRAAQGGTWVTNARGNGLLRLDSNGYPVELANGHPLEIPFASVQRGAAALRPGGYEGEAVP